MSYRDALIDIARAGNAPFTLEQVAFASDTEVATYWQQCKDTFDVFHVGCDGHIEDPDDGEWVLPTYRQLYSAPEREEMTVALLLDNSNLMEQLEWLIDWYEPGENTLFEDDPDLWLKTLPAEDQHQVLDLLNDYLDEEADSGHCDNWDFGGDVSAWSYFSGLFDDGAEELCISCYEGDQPGGSYRGARLKIPVSEANRVAAKYRLPCRFVAG